MGKLSTLALAAAGVGAYLVFSRKKTAKASDGSTILLSDKHKPIGVKDGEIDSVANYRIIGARRPNMTYMPVTEGAPPGIIGFPCTKTGAFTRNILQEGGRLFAEVK